jgi:hypothetical protein
MKLKHLVVIFSLITIGLPFAWSTTEPQSHLTDDVIRQRIVGTWMVNLRAPNGNSIVGSDTILVGGTSNSKATLTIGDRKEEIEVSGTWQVKDGYLIGTVKKSNSVLLPVGKTTRDKVLTLDDNVYVFQMENGKTMTRQRSK